MLRTLAAVGALLPGLALAQVTAGESSDFENGDDEIINIAECNTTTRSTFSFIWNFGSGTPVQAGLLKVSNTENCPAQGTTENESVVTETLEEITSFQGTSDPIPAPDLVTRAGFACNTPETSGGSLRSIFICATTGSGTTSTNLSVIVRLDNRVPPPPRVLSASPGNGALEVDWDASSGADRYRVVATPPAGSPHPTVTSPETKDTDRRITGLVNGVTYSVSVVAISIGGNPSNAESNKVPGTPVQTSDFWRHYQNQPGAQEEGGCSTAGGGGSALLALLPLAAWLGGRRRS
jgi:uncharacterized protein (TIGR03382 family)